jgi:hypothetical protein
MMCGYLPVPLWLPWAFFVGDFRGGRWSVLNHASEEVVERGVSHFRWVVFEFMTSNGCEM